MATITLSVGANTKSWTISPEHVQRIVDAVKRETGRVEDPPGSGTMRDPTAAECFAIIASRFETDLREMVKNSERQAVVVADLDMV